VVNLVFKNTHGKYTVLRCPVCRKVFFHKYYIPKEERKYHIFKCCECGVQLEYIDIETDKIEIEL